MDRTEKISQEAKQIMDTFFESLQKADVKIDEFGVIREKQTRNPSTYKDTGFKEKMFANAKNKDNDYLYAEKKHW